MRIYGTVDILNFDSDGYNKALRQALEIQFRQAARAFIRAAVPKIPVQTGMARGSFLNIAQFLRVAIPIAPSVFGKFYYPPGGGRLPKTPDSGASLTTPPNQIISFDGNRIKFELQSSVFHLTLEDIIGVRSPTAPWRSFEAGRIAFMQEMRNLKRRLPKIKSFMTKTTVTFGRGNIIEAAPIRLRKQETVSG